MKIFEFLKEERPTDDGVELEDILKMLDEKLEQTHTVIQWCFPLDEPSRAQPYSPILTRLEALEIVNDTEASNNLLLLTEKWFDFYGFPKFLWKRTNSGNLILKMESTTKEYLETGKLFWWQQNNHNHLRLTRIMRSLRYLGLEEYSLALFKQLKLLALKYPDGVTNKTLIFWNESQMKKFCALV